MQLVHLLLLSVVTSTALFAVAEAVTGSFGFAVGFLLGLSSSRRGGFLGGGRRNRRRNRNRFSIRIGRSAGDEEDHEVLHHPLMMDSVDLQEEKWFLMASQEDYDDCIKSYVCGINARQPSELNAYEREISTMFAQTQMEIDPKSGAVEFDLASVVGSSGGLGQCRSVYARCQMDFPTISALVGDQIQQSMQYNMQYVGAN